jgi:hypothetical protein
MLLRSSGKTQLLITQVLHSLLSQQCLHSLQGGYNTCLLKPWHAL